MLLLQCTLWYQSYIRYIISVRNNSWTFCAPVKVLFIAQRTTIPALFSRCESLIKKLFKATRRSHLQSNLSVYVYVCVWNQTGVISIYYITALGLKGVRVPPREIYFLLQNSGRYKSSKEAVKRHGNIKREAREGERERKKKKMVIPEARASTAV